MTVGTALVVGASRGLGVAVARDLSEHGWDVIGTSRTPPGHGFPSAARWIRHDLGVDDIELVAEAVSGIRLDALVVTAMKGGPQGGILEIDASTLAESFNVAVVGVVRLVQAVLPGLLLAPAPTIVIVSSRLGSVSAQAAGRFRDFDTSYAYRVSKAAQNMVVASLAQELAGRVRCLAVHPGTLATAMGRPGATKTAAEAAAQLREVLESGNSTSPRFLSLGDADLTW